MAKPLKVLIVGQGLAGSLLSWAFIKKNVEITLIDSGIESASHIAAGVLKPINGRHLALSWKYLEYKKEADRIFENIESNLKTKFFHKTDIFQLLTSNGLVNDWMGRMSDPNYEGLLNFPSGENLPNWLKELNYPAIGVIKNSGWVDVPLMLKGFKNYFLKRGILRLEKFSFEEITISDEKNISYKNEAFDFVIFSEGIQGIHNPYFNYLPLLGRKGERMMIEIPEISGNEIIKKNIQIIPQSENVYWIGSNFEVKFEDPSPTEKIGSFFLQELEELNLHNLNILDHSAAVRPTVLDRRPLIGMHPKYSSLGIFNGMGSKGCLYAPYMAELFVNEILEQKSYLPREVRIERYGNLLPI
jgi:glycine/D-amino acid oxidase-like deaminating enzyme